MNNEVLIKVEGVSKKFCRNLKKSLIYGGSDIVKGFLGMERSEELRNDEFWAVNDVNFELRRGECLGLIGHNGAGKSTLLKMLNGLIRPDKGRIEMRGKVGALIELGAGFSPLLTGRENVYINGTVLGFTKEEIDRKFDEIVEFAELKDFIDSPVQNYSSGMKVRLGFAIAAQMEPDILLIDEVLAVGDIGFVLKCFNRIDKLLQNTAIIFVSHNMPQVSRIASKILMLDKGKELFYSNNVSEGLTQYYKSFNLKTNNDFKASDKAILKKIRILDNKSNSFLSENCTLNAGDDLVVEIVFLVSQKINRPSISLALYDIEQRVFAEIRGFEYEDIVKSIEGEFVIHAKIKNPPLSQGKYSIMVYLGEDAEKEREAILRIQSAIYFTVHSQNHAWCPILFNAQWDILKN